MMLGPVANLKGSMVTLYLVPELELEALVSRPGANATILGRAQVHPRGCQWHTCIIPVSFLQLQLEVTVPVTVMLTRSII